MAARTEAPRVNLYSVSNKYGVIESKLRTGFSNDTEAIERKYRIENIPSEVMDVCKEIAGVAGRALIVGGSVRDCVISQEHQEMKIKPKDFDLEVYGLSPEELQNILETTFGADRVDSVGRAFGILKVRIDGWDEPLDFSIPREDSKVDEGHKGFAITGRPDMSIREAAARRDITANSMAYDPLTETIYDPYGGIKDIKNKIIRVTDEKAFQEDPLRVIRIMQFAARFEFNVDPETEELCRQMVARDEVSLKRSKPKDESSFVPGEIEGEDEEKKGFYLISGNTEVYLKPKEKDNKGLAKERVTEEFYKLLLKGRKPSLGMEFAMRIGLVEKLWPDIAAMKGVKQEHSWHPEGDVWNHSMQTMDAMVEIANTEITEGKIPTADQIKRLDEQVEKYITEKTKSLFQNLVRKEISTKLGTNILVEIDKRVEAVGNSIRDEYIDRRLSIIRLEAMGKATNIFNNDYGFWDEESREWTLYNEAELNKGISDPEMMAKRRSEFRDQKITEIYGRIYPDTVNRLKNKWLTEALPLVDGAKQKEEKKLLEVKLQEMISSGAITKERSLELEEMAEAIAKTLSISERKRRMSLLKSDLKIVLVMTALCHDLGKVFTTKFEDGRIRSKQHEQEGVEPMRRVLQAFDLTRFSSEMRAMMLPLIAEHLKPGEIYRDITNTRTEEDESGSDEEESQGGKEDIKQLKRRLTRLAHRLAYGDGDRSLKGGKKKVIYGDGGGASLYMLGLVAKADNMGRDESGQFTTTEAMGNKLKWLEWWNARIEEYKLDVPEEKMFNGDDLLQRLGMDKKQSGPWMGVISKLISRDVIDGMVKKDKEDVLQAAVDYYRRLSIWVNSRYEMLPAETRTERDRTRIWEQLQKMDIREEIG